MSDENTLRDALTSAVEQIEAPAAEVSEVVQEQSAESKARDEQGRFTSKPPEKSAAEHVAPEVVTEPPLQRPSSWKKEMWPVWDKLSTGQPLNADEAKQLAKYNHERESQFASGVSTYREEAVKSQAINEALAPFMQDLQQNNINPAQWITNLGNAHTALVKGTPEQKAAMFVQLLNDYQPPLHMIFQQGQDGSLRLNNSLQPVRQAPPVDVRGAVKDMLQEERINSTIENMRANTEQYPHFEAVREKMAGLLQAGLAPDLESAYAHALRLDDELWQADQQRQAESAEKQRLQAEADRVHKARANAVSPRGATPAGTNVANGKRGLRDTLEEQVSAVLGGGRV